MTSLLFQPTPIPWAIFTLGLSAPELITSPAGLATLSTTTVPLLLLLTNFGRKFLTVAFAFTRSLVWFGQWVRRRFFAFSGAEQAGFVGDTARVTETIPVYGLGLVHYRGTSWSARTAVGKTHKPGDGVTIRRVEGLVLLVE